MNILETERLSIRALETEDIDILFEWENDDSVWRVSSTRAPLSRHVLMRFIKSQCYDPFESKQMRLAVELKSEKRAIGTVDIFDIDIYNSRAGVGILVYAADDRGKGYAAEVIEAIKRYCFHVIDLRQLYCNIAADNEQSLRLFKRCGFEVSGVKRDWIRRKEGWQNEVFMQCLTTPQEEQDEIADAGI